MAGSIATTSPRTPIFYRLPRLATHIDDRAIAAGGALYTELGLDGSVLDLMFKDLPRPTPAAAMGLGMNAAELAANAMLSQYVVHDLNADPILPFPDASFDAATCCVSVDYLTNPITVFIEVGRVLRPGGAFVVAVAGGGEPPPGLRRRRATSVTPPTGNVPR